ncbi:MAG: DNA gyrase subunit A [Duodenibacillus sp.]|nr:DNA gyrase subunit A [Duodenibacillus sp.]
MPISYSLETLPVTIETEMKRSYLDYAMSVIVGRALPDVRDGFKPVHRRVLFAMHQLGNNFSSPTKKCARIIGEVLGKYHPHGDQAAYQTLVRLAQDFSMRYPLVYGQGNFGSIDGDGAAAMRYTECRLAQISETMLAGLDEETVDFMPNFDNSETEPEVLPAQLPNLLVNGSAGIAVGMATNIPPHNLKETVDACRHLLAHPDAGIDELIGRLPAPDFPTGAVIYGLDGVHEAYRTGRGRVVMRSHTHIEETRSGRQVLVVDDIPYQVNKKVLVESIARLMHEKKIDGIAELRDESSKTVRIVMELKQGAMSEVLLNNLYKLTMMQSSFGVNMVALVHGQPRLLNLRQIIEAFLSHRREVVTRRTIFRLNKNRARGHILEGFAVALCNLDEFLAIIRAAPTPAVAKAQLMARGWDSALVTALVGAANAGDYRPLDVDPCYGLHEDGLYYLSDVQADRILQMALSRLTGLEQEKINAEYRETHAMIADLLDILARPERVVRIMDEELAELKEKYGDERRSEICRDGDSDFDPRDFIVKESAVITLSKEGYVKRCSLAEYRKQRRGGVGRRAGKTREGDIIDQLFIANTHDEVLCFTSLGRVFSLDVYKIPETSRAARGSAIVNLLQLDKDAGEKVRILLPVDAYDAGRYVVMATAGGVIKKTALPEFEMHNKNGKRAIILDEGDELVGVALSDGEHDVMLVSSLGRCIRFSEGDVRGTGRSSRGIGGMRLPEGAKVLSMAVVKDEAQMLLVACENGYGKCTPVSEFTRHGRNTMGVTAINASERNGAVVGALLVTPDDSVLLLTSSGMVIRTGVDAISVTGRIAQGVKLVDLDGGDVLASMSRVMDKEIGEDEASGEAQEAPGAQQAPEQAPADGAESGEPQA